MKTTTTPQDRLRKAQQAIRDGEARNLGERTMNKRWNAFFAAEDALKASGAWL